ncbi:hypothetical protein Salat_1404500 [Sesamum alatum]|uniref:Uncharacterized protein n=1 Tax=Sesamum alatum TaxID=300844 RepID=A0AAE1YAD8_9LAMI|nr:hypothetical protein Salat_1404500 [Sesamum alatum]
MANYFQNIPMFLFLILALTVCLEIQSTQGRQLKHDFIRYVQTPTGLQIHARKLEQKSGSTQKHDFQFQGSIEKQKISTASESREYLSSSVISHSDGFQPTATGHSPGMGHSYVGSKDNMDTKIGLTTTGEIKESLKGPGHSPGIGHSSVNLN